MCDSIIASHYRLVNPRNRQSATNFDVESTREIPLESYSSHASLALIRAVSSRENFPRRGNRKKVGRRLACIVTSLGYIGSAPFPKCDRVNCIYVDQINSFVADHECVVNLMKLLHFE